MNVRMNVKIKITLMKFRLRVMYGSGEGQMVVSWTGEGHSILSLTCIGGRETYSFTF